MDKRGERRIPCPTQDHPQAALGQAESAEGGTSKTQTSANRGAREMVEVRRTGILQLSCGPWGIWPVFEVFRIQVIRRWMRALRRRGQKSRITWPRLVALAQRWLPLPSILTGGPARLASNWMLWYRTLEPEFRSGLRYPRDRISPVDPGPLRCERCEKFIRRGAAATYVF